MSDHGLTFKVGATLFVAGRGHDRDYEITNVGRKWASLGEGLRKLRVDMATGRVYESDVTVYSSRDAYEARRTLSKAWSEFERDFRNRFGMPPGMTIEKIDEARRLLGLERS